jgi:hypothetical protein
MCSCQKLLVTPPDGSGVRATNGNDFDGVVEGILHEEAWTIRNRVAVLECESSHHEACGDIVEVIDVQAEVRDRSAIVVGDEVELSLAVAGVKPYDSSGGERGWSRLFDESESVAVEGAKLIDASAIVEGRDVLQCSGRARTAEFHACELGDLVDRLPGVGQGAGEVEERVDRAGVFDVFGSDTVCF